MAEISDEDCLRRLCGMIERGRKAYRGYRKLSAHTGVSASNLQRIASRQIIPNITMVNRVARALKEEFCIGYVE